MVAGAIATVWPSVAGDCATIEVAIVPAAPGRFSTITCWPRCLARGTANARATASVAAPGGKGTSRVTGLLGKVAAGCACEAIGSPEPAAASASSEAIIARRAAAGSAGVVTEGVANRVMRECSRVAARSDGALLAGERTSVPAGPAAWRNDSFNRAV